MAASRRYAFASTSRIFRSLFARNSSPVAASARSFGLAARRGSASEKETGGNVGERERFHVPPVPEGKRRAGHSSILASRADGLSLPLPLWLSSSSSSSPLLAKSLYLFRLARPTSSSQLTPSLRLSLSLFSTSTQLPASTPTTQTPPTDTASLLAGPLAGRIIKVPEGDGQSESRGMGDGQE